MMLPYLKNYLNSLPRKYLVVLFYAILSLSIMAPLFKPGYILMLDASSMSLGFGDHLFGQGIGERLPYHLIAGVVDSAFPHWVIQKIVWFFAFLFAGLSAHILCPTEEKAGKYFAGVLYMINPFVYSRLLAGQSLLVLSYALIPFAIYYYVALLEKGGNKSLILTVVLTTIIATLQMQMLFLTFISFLIILLLKMIQERQDSRHLLEVTKKVGLLSTFFLLLNVYWLVPLFTAESSILSLLGREDMLYFAPRDTTEFSIGFSILSLHGFWLHGPYLYTKDILPGWWLVTLLILYLSIFGIVTRWRNGKYGIYVKSMTIIGIVAIILALGVSTDVTRHLFTFLWEHIFFFPAFRDSHKFVALLVLAYSFLGGLGVAALVESLGKKNLTKVARLGLTTLVIVSLAAPILNCFTIFNGFWGQLKPTNFPEDWYEVNDFLSEDKDDFNIVFLPWHGYMDYSWLPQSYKRMRNLSDWFFDKPVIGGDTLEAGTIYTQSLNPMSHYIEYILGLPEKKDRNIVNLGELVSLVNAKYILLTKEDDWEWYYEFLHRQEDLALVKETTHFLVFRNEHLTARVYQVSNVVNINNMDQLLTRSKSDNVMDYLYLIGDGNDVYDSTKNLIVTYEVKSAAKYTINSPTNKYIIFIPTQQMSVGKWNYDGAESLKQIGFVPAFKSSGEGGNIVYTRFYNVYLPSYLLSTLSMTTLFLYFMWAKRRRN